MVNAMTDMEFDKFVRPLENSLASKFSRRQINLQISFFSSSSICQFGPFCGSAFKSFQSTFDLPSMIFTLVILVWRKSQQTKKDSAAAKKKEKVSAKYGLRH